MSPSTVVTCSPLRAPNQRSGTSSRTPPTPTTSTTCMPTSLCSTSSAGQYLIFAHSVLPFEVCVMCRDVIVFFLDIRFFVTSQMERSPHLFISHLLFSKHSVTAYFGNSGTISSSNDMRPYHNIIKYNLCSAFQTEGDEHVHVQASLWRGRGRNPSAGCLHDR